MIRDPLAPEEGATEREARLKAEAIAARRAARAPWQNAHFDRLAREQEARRVAREFRRMETVSGFRTCSKCHVAQPLPNYPLMPSGNPHATCKTCKASQVREAKNRKRLGLAPRRRGQSADVSADLARLTDLAAALAGTNPDHCISTEHEWNNVANELQRLWLQSGDKECVSCKALVPPSAILPPGPANFYPGMCRSCAKMAYEASHRATFGPPVGPLPGPPKILMRDGSRITVAELSRRHREREAGRLGPRPTNRSDDAEVLPESC